MKAITSSQMRRLDERAIQRYGIPVLLLMDHAGRAVAEASRKMLEYRRIGVSASRHSPIHRHTDTPIRIIVLTGGGNNGGDGVAAARWLRGWGFFVEVYWLKNPQNWDGTLRQHYDMARRAGVRFRPFSLRTDFTSADILIDALLGTGSSGELRGDYRAAIEAMNAAKKPIIAVDIPSGLHADTGQALTPGAPIVRARVTVTMAATKKGLLTRAAKSFVGRLWIADIGFPFQIK